MQPNRYLPRPLPPPLEGLAQLALDLRGVRHHGTEALWQTIDTALLPQEGPRAITRRASCLFTPMPLCHWRRTTLLGATDSLARSVRFRGGAWLGNLRSRDGDYGAVGRSVCPT
jgi:hypothetical protein